MKWGVMRKNFTSCLSIVSIITASLITVVSSSPAAAVTYGTISGTVTAGGAPVPAGSVQVVFVKYNKRPSTLPAAPNDFGPCTDGSPAAPSVNLLAVTVGANGTYSHSLDTNYFYKIIFKPLTTAPRSAQFRWYSSSLSGGTTVGFNFNSAIQQATCITTLTTSGLTGINVSTSGSSIQLTGSLTTSSGAPVSATGAAINIVRTPTCYVLSPDGYSTRANDAGQWELAGVDVNQTSQYLQVLVPPAMASCNFPNSLLYAKRVGTGYTLIPSNEVTACGDACKFNFTTTDISNISLQLPVIGEINGTVSGPNGAVGAGQVCVNAFRDGGTANNYYSMLSGTACTDSNGRYSIGLTYESYRIQFVNQYGFPFKSAWNAATSAEGYSKSTAVCVKTSGTGCAATKTVDITLDEGKSISGRVSSVDGPVSNATVHAMMTSPTGGLMGVGYSRTNSDGDYSIFGLDAGTYTLMFSHEDYGQQWLGGSRESGQSFLLSANIIGKNMTLIRGSSLSGTIATGDSSEARICVSAYKVTSSNMGWGDFAAGNCFTAPGIWNLKGIANGSYRIRFDAQTGNLRSTFLGGTDYTEATLVTVNGSNVSNLAVTIPTGKSITGRISDVTKNEWVSSACVNAFLVKDDYFGYGAYSGTSCTDTNGQFTIRGLAEGTYTLQLQPPGNSDLTPGWYEEFGNPVRQNSSASRIVINSSSGLVTNVTTQSMQTGPRIIAKLVNGSAAPVSGICVDAVKVANDTYGWGEWSGNSCSGIDGQISLRGLTPGNYKFRVNANAGDFQNGWINIATSTTSSAQSAVGIKELSASDTILDLGTIALVSGSKATGKFVSGGTNVAGVCIEALKVVTAMPWGEWSGSACTQSAGEFTIGGLDPTASYKFRVNVWQGDFKPGFLADNGTIQSSPEGITGKAASTTIQLGDIELVTAPSIKGTIFSGLSTKESNVCINAHLATTYQWVASSCSQQNGSYALRGLDPDTEYKLSWWTPKPLLTSGWYKSAISGATQEQNPALADSILVPTAGRTGIDIRIASGGSITGTLASGLCVAAWLTSKSEADLDSSKRENTSATTCADGEDNFELRGLLPNTDYYLQVFKIDGVSVTQTSPTGDAPIRTGGASVPITAS
jgi:hypothetical protein